MNTLNIEREAGPHPAIGELLAIPVFAGLPVEGLEWLAAQMTAVDWQPGEIVIRAGDPAEHLLVLFHGELRAEREDGGVYIARTGQVTGLLPYSRLTLYPSTGRAVVSSRAALLHKDLFPEMLRRMPALQERLVNVMADRIRESTKADDQREKLIALGKLSAGLAHELNNPAAAARRAADNLRKVLHSVRAAALELDRRGLPQSARVFLAQLDCDWARQAGPQSALDTLDRSEREEDLAVWLQQHQVRQPWDLAAALVDIGCTKDTLEEIARQVPPEFLSDALTRQTASFTITRLVEEIESSAGKISELVRAVKEYSYMDQMPEQEIDIHDGVENTLIMLRHRLKNWIEIVRNYDRALPRVCAHGSELNQVWTNLIANAADAMKDKGKLLIKTSGDGERVTVEIVDNGSGIPPEVQSRIFEPFFTTKPAGEGTGLGLDTVYRIVKNHHGDIRFESRPGETRFVVRIPVSKPKAANP